MIIWHLQNFKRYKEVAGLVNYEIRNLNSASSAVCLVFLPDELALPWVQNEIEVEQRCSIAPFYFRFPSRKEVDQYLLPQMVAFVTLVLMN